MLCVAMLGTLRRDGSPCISPIEPYLVNGRLLVGAMKFRLTIIGEIAGTMPRITSRKIHRYKAYAGQRRSPAIRKG